MNRSDIQSLHLNQLIDQLGPHTTVWELQRPMEGWLRKFRLALGLSLKSVAERLKVSPQAIHQLEKSEAAQSISLRQLEAVAGAMGCRVFYTLVPRQGAVGELANDGQGERPRVLREPTMIEGRADRYPEGFL